MNLTDYDVIGPNGFRICSLNKKMADKQGVTDKELSALVFSHQIKHQLFYLSSNTNESLKQKMLSALLETLEYKQQELWHFPQDRNYHRWFDLPGCTCPKLDNEERLGSKFRVFLDTCPAHGRI